MNRTHRGQKALLVAVGLLAATVWLTDFWVKTATRKQLFTDLKQLPHRKVGLLLGTSKKLRGGADNLYYRYRIAAAVELFRAGKVDYLLVSGDNGTEDYNEPGAMQADLLAAGIPADRIVCDYAGFRTLDSLLRCARVFGEQNITIISQPFHNERALFIANHKGMNAVAFNAQDVSHQYGLKVQAREKLARVKVLLDLALHKGPRFYGPRIRIG